MQTIILDFNTRVQEINTYFSFLEGLDNETIKLTSLDNIDEEKNKLIDYNLLIKTLKANSFLLLYNLVESTMRNAIESIFDELQNKDISYDQIRPELKKIVLKNLKKRNIDDLHKSTTAISIGIITAGFDREDLFSGNLDSREIRSTATKYGFSHLTDYAKTNHGKDLLTIKTNRNDLAHGWKSFKEIGKDKSTDELLEIKNKTVKYLKQILQNIEQYLSNQEYLDSSTSDNL
jgi:hypothetical protein